MAFAGRSRHGLGLVEKEELHSLSSRASRSNKFFLQRMKHGEEGSKVPRAILLWKKKIKREKLRYRPMRPDIRNGNASVLEANWARPSCGWLCIRRKRGKLS